jgi:alpha-amylase
MKQFFFTALIIVLPLFSQNKPLLSPKSDVFMQGFYWNSTPGGIWYDSLAALAPKLASAGIGGIWFPSPSKGAGGGFSMGYDPYDHYDFGEYFQKGSKETRFGSKQELINAIATFHTVGIEVYADAVMRHMMGGETKAPYECIPFHNGFKIVADSAYLTFNYPNGSGRFKKGPAQFYPNSEHCFVDGRFVETDPLFRFGEWLDHNKQSVKDSLIEWGKYLRNELKFDGFRLDAVKPIDPVFMAAFLNGANGNGYAVAELWSSAADIGSWLNVAKNQNGAKVAMFDFPLRYTLKEMCNNTGGGFDMRALDNAGLAGAGISGFDYSTFVENHDFDRTGFDGATDNGHDPVLTDKHLGYAYILFSEGRPCIFFKDYFTYGYAGAIDTLIWIRQNFLAGGTTKRSGLNPYYVGGSGTQDDLAKDIYVARRNGGNGKPASYLVINDHPTEWRGVWVNSDYPSTKFKDYTHHDIDNNIKPSQADGRIDLWAPPRSYVIYVPDTSQMLNHPPVLNRIPDVTGYTNAQFQYSSVSNDANGQQLTYSLTGNPAWLYVTSNGSIVGLPTFDDTGHSVIILKVSDPLGLFDADTFSVTVKLNRDPVLASMSDTSATAAKRFERTIRATDVDGDTLSFSLQSHPGWLTVGTLSGILSGTPAIGDTGSSIVRIFSSDGKGGTDTLAFSLTVFPAKDSIIATYRKPTIDGSINISGTDWDVDWRVAADSDTDSYWWSRSTMVVNNEMYGIYVTWDSDSLYLGLDYYINDINNTAILYVDAVKDSGRTNFNSTQGWLGDYPKNNRFRLEDGIDLFVASYNKEKPNTFLVAGNQSINISTKANGVRGLENRGLEIAVSFNEIYGLGAGLVPKHAALKLVALASGGYDYGSGDAVPDNPDVNGDGGPDSLINLTSVVIDKNGDGIPDPTLLITNVLQNMPARYIPASFSLKQNFPNPFNPSTTISFSIPISPPLRGTVGEADRGSHTTVTIHDLLGRQVATLVNHPLQPGNYSVTWNAQGFTSGIYFYTLKSGDFVSTKKLLLLK